MQGAVGFFLLCWSKLSLEETEEGDPKADFLEDLSPLRWRDFTQLSGKGMHMAAPRFRPGYPKACWPGSKHDSLTEKG